MFLVNLILVILIVLLLFILSWVWPPDSPWSFWWRTSRKKSRDICKLARVTKKDIFYELGSGEGNTIIVAAKEFGAQAVGIEIDPIRLFFSQLMVFFSGQRKKIHLKKENFFNVDISSATVVYVYLVPKALEKLMPKFRKELQPGTRIVSLKYSIDLPLKKRDEKNNLFLYTIK